MSEYEFLEITPAKIPDIWPLIKTGVLELNERAKEWTPEQLCGSLCLNAATLTLVMFGEEPAGFVVYRWAQQPLTGEKYLHVWLYYIFEDHRGDLKNFLYPTLDYLKKVKQEGGGAYVEVPSTRQGWGRALKGRYEFAYIVYRSKEVRP